MKASARKKNGKWIAFVELGYDASGKRKQITKVPPENTKVSAQELANELLAKYLNNTFYVEQKMLVSEYMDTWLEQHKSNISYNTYNFYEGLIRIYINPGLGNLRLDKLHSTHIQQFYSDLRENTNLSNSTIKKIHVTLHNALKYATQHEIIPKNPCENVVVPKQQKFKPVVLDEEQLSLLLKKLKETPIFIPCIISVYSGMRKGEVLGLTWVEPLHLTLRLEGGDSRFISLVSYYLHEPHIG